MNIKRISAIVLMGVFSSVSTGAFSDGSAVSACNTPGPWVNYLSILVNTSSQSQIITCTADPITFALGELRADGYVGGSFGVEIAGLERSTGVRLERLRVVDNHPSQNISCFLYARKADGTHLVSSTVSSSGTGDMNIANGLTLNVGGDQARVTLQCSIPGSSSGNNSGIVEFHVNPVTTTVF